MRWRRRRRADDGVDLDVDDYRPVSLRQRLVLIAAGVATAIAVVMLLLHPPGGVERTRKVVVPECTASDVAREGCVGGKAVVIVPPSAPR